MPQVRLLPLGLRVENVVSAGSEVVGIGRVSSPDDGLVAELSPVKSVVEGALVVTVVYSVLVEATCVVLVFSSSALVSWALVLDSGSLDELCGAK
jgi:hypothetical protein